MTEAPSLAGIDPTPGGTAVALGADDLALLLRLSQAVSGHREREALLAAAARVLADRLPLDRLLVEEAAVEGSVSAWVMRERRPLVVSRRDEIRERFPVTHRALAREGIESLVALPLGKGERCFGALRFASRVAGAWDAWSLRLLEEIGAVLAVALENCLAWEHLHRLTQEREALLDVNRAIGRHLHRDDLFGAMARGLRAVVPMDRFGIELPIEGDRLQGHLLTPHDTGAEPTQPTFLPAKGTACNWVLENREWIVASSREELRARFPVTFDVMERECMQSLCALPLVTDERCRGVLFFMAAQEGAYRELRRDVLEQVTGAAAVALDDCLAHEEVARLRDRLAAENVYLQEEIRQEHNFQEMVGKSAALRTLLSQIRVMGPTASTVLILGETGTGKELVARALHDQSPRRTRPLVKVNCAAISAGLVESELFGHVKGAFTGASATRPGRFELADGGTIFLDEIGDLPVETQVKLLRVLQEREYEPVGSSETRKVDVRMIAATNRDLARAVAEGRFRSDLYFRLNVLEIRVPPLRERREDIPLLALAFASRYALELGKRIDDVSPETMQRLIAYDWPGNVRELSNVIERLAVLTSGPELELGAQLERGARLPGPAPTSAPGSAPAVEAPAAGASPVLDEVLRSHILSVLEQTRWVIEGPRGAARQLGLHASTLHSRMKKLGIRRPG